MSLTDVDPTGTLSAATAAVGLVGAVLRVAPAIKNFTDSASRTNSNNVSGTGPLYRAESTPHGVHSLTPNPESERRAYETVNFVLREIGSRLCAAGLVDEHALTKALTAATQHIEVKLFSAEANRLFESLAPKLADPILVNSVFTSIYLIGAMTAELSSSLPNYKDTYAPLGPRLVQQVFRAAIGEDAFRDNLTANLDAYKTLATTAGLLRPTDIGYLTFPQLPSFAPCKYSSKSFTDVRHNKSTFEKLVKHFDRAGFPQPTPARRAEVGLIQDWRFLSSDANSRVFDVEKADKNIGENFGKVLHWLLCSAERIPPGQAVIAYYDQHVQLVKWIGYRMGYTLLFPTVDLNMSGPHAVLDGRARHVFESWILIMSSEPARASKKAMSERWMQSRMQSAAKAGPPPVAQAQRITHPTQPISPRRTMSQSTTGQSYTTTASGSRVTMPAVAAVVAPELASNAPSMQMTETRLEEVERHLNFNLSPYCQNLLSHPPNDPKAKESECRRMTRVLEKEILEPLDAIQVVNNDSARHRKQEMILQLNNLFDGLKAAISLQNVSKQTPPKLMPLNPQIATSLPNSGGSPPICSSTLISPQVSAASTQGIFFPAKRMSTVVRRKAPPPPKKFILAKAIHTFEPETDNDEEVGFNEGDEVEIIEKTSALEEDGWCRARVNGQKKIGLVPLDYLEILPRPSTPSNKPAKPLMTASLSADDIDRPHKLDPAAIPVHTGGHGWTGPPAAPTSAIPVSITPNISLTPTSLASHPSQDASASLGSVATHAPADAHTGTFPQSHQSSTVAHQFAASAHQDSSSPLSYYQTPLSGLIGSSYTQHVPLATGSQPLNQNQNHLTNDQHQLPVCVGSQPSGQVGQSNNVTHRSRKLEAAGLGIAAVGAASAFIPGNGIAGNQQVIENQTVINTSDQQSGSDSVNGYSFRSAEANDSLDRNNDGGIQVEATHNHTDTSVSGGLDTINTNDNANFNGSEANRTATVNEYLEAPLIADLSAFSEPPFNPQYSAAQSGPVLFSAEASPMPESPVTAVSTDPTTNTDNEFEYTNTNTVEISNATSPLLSSPFASLATPNAGQLDACTGNDDLSTYESATLVEKSSLVATPMNQQSADAAVLNATYSEREGDGVAQEVTYDLEF